NLFISGLATDFCVAYSALDARRLGFDVTVIEAGCRGIDVGGSLADAWRLMEAAGGVRAERAGSVFAFLDSAGGLSCLATPRRIHGRVSGSVRTPENSARRKHHEMGWMGRALPGAGVAGGAGRRQAQRGQEGRAGQGREKRADAQGALRRAVEG